MPAMASKGAPAMSNEEEVYEDGFEGPPQGYSDLDFSTLDEKEVELHDQLLEVDWKDALKMDASKMTDLQIWALAQAIGDYDPEGDEALTSQAEARFEQLCRQLVASKAAHPALDYGGIGLILLEEMMLDERWDDAMKFLADVDRHVPEDSRVKDRFTALITILRGDEDKGFSMIQDMIAEAEEARDASLLYAIANDLVSIEMLEDAESILDTVGDMASLDGDDELVEMVADLRSLIVEMYQSMAEDGAPN
jgi:hypothetical protein